MRDYKELKPYQFKPKVAKDEIPKLNAKIKEWESQGKDKNQIMGLIMHDIPCHFFTAQALYKNYLLTR